ncbi:hypothetical protein PybrP1_012191 [[Pythium] brassicae (nom. inval.)]|nr:hypothetical protein PybrP1_012191 [[Pythium] brassicae (nom. inval.)]
MAGKRRAGAGAGAGGGVGAAPPLNAPPATAAALNAAAPPRAKSSGNGNLTNLQRKRICEFHQKSGGVMSQKDLAQWTKHEFGLQKTPAQSTISGILRRQHEFVNMSALELGIKKRRVVQHPLLDQALANWVIQCAHRGITFNAESSANGAGGAGGGAGTGAGGATASARSGDSKRVLHFTTMEALVHETDKFELANIFAMDETCRLDFAMGAQKRRVLLFLNDAPSHVVSHLELSHVVLFVLPTGASQMLNPVTASLVAAFKKRFRRHHLRHAIDKGGDASSGRRAAFNVDVLQAMKWATLSWSEVAKDTVERSWALTHMVPDRLPVLRFHGAEDAELAFLDTELAHLVLFLRLPDALPVADYLNDEAKCAHSVHEEFFEVVQHADEVPDDDCEHADADATAANDGTGGGNGGAQSSLSLQEKLKAFRDVLQVLKDRDDSDDAASALRRVQDALRTEARSGVVDPPLLGGDAPAIRPSEENGAGASAAFDSASLDFASTTMTALENEAKFMSDALSAQANGAAAAAAAAAAASAAAEAMLSHHQDDDVGAAFDHAVL